MYVANYLPEPESRPGSVNKERYAVRVQFIRNVTYRLIAVSFIIALVAYLTPARETNASAIWVFFGFLFGLSILRTVLLNQVYEAKLAGGLLPLLVVVSAVAARASLGLHFPVWSVLFGLTALGMYTLVCGRDYSFVGGYVLAMIFSNVAIAAYMVAIGAPTSQSTYAILWNSLGCLYFQYDLAAMMYRRLRGETWAAVTDLFRDMFNIIGWLPKVVRHWYRHRILNDLSFELPFRIGQ
jgi:hypothetical protein